MFSELVLFKGPELPGCPHIQATKFYKTKAKNKTREIFVNPYEINADVQAAIQQILPRERRADNRQILQTLLNPQVFRRRQGARVRNAPNRDP